MKINSAGLELVKSFEGLYLQGYLCPAGVPTIGYGHTGTVDGKPITTAMKITREKADILLAEDMAKFERVVMQYDPIYHWNENEFSALVSFAFNVGNIHQLTNNGTRTRAQIEIAILKYNKAAGTILPGLSRRRQAELELFRKPVPAAKPATKEENGVVLQQIKIQIDGSAREVLAANVNGNNYVKLRDIAPLLGYDVSANGATPVLKKK